MLRNISEAAPSLMPQARGDDTGNQARRQTHDAHASASQRMQALLVLAPAERQAELRPLLDQFAALGIREPAVSFDTVAELSACLLDREIHIAVLHVEMAARIGAEGLTQLRGEHPDIDWVLAWQGRAPDLVELAIRMHARAGVDLAQPGQAVIAIQQVAAGHFWLPRWMLHDLYAALLDERRFLALGVLPSHGSSGPALTQRELEVLALLHEGRTNREIGDRLGISVSTVKKHLKNAYDKRGLHSRRQALR